MTICLEWWSVPQWWPVPWKRAHYDPVSGRAAIALRSCGHIARGKAWRTAGKWYALRADAGELVLQVNSAKLRFSEIVAFEVTRRSARWATVRIEGNGIVLSCDYRHAAGRLWNRWDPTFDGLDEQLADFFVFALRLWQSSDRGAELAKSWSQPEPKPSRSP